MKGLLFHIILPAFLIVCASHAIQAQDAGMSDVEIVHEHDGESAGNITYAPGEDLRYVPDADGVVRTKDSVVLQIQDFPMQQATMTPPESPSNEAEKTKDDSILTFNFLYYIIQKYKLQDIID